jgi:hypothetical protein
MTSPDNFPEPSTGLSAFVVARRTGELNGSLSRSARSTSLKPSLGAVTVCLV